MHHLVSSSPYALLPVLRVDDYVTESESQNYAQLYKNLDDLVGRVQGSIIRKLSSEEAQDKKAAATPTTG